MSSNNKKTVQLVMREVKLDWKDLITLPQMRTEFPIERLRELANNIAEIKGFINPQIVAVLSEEAFVNYTAYVCKVWKKSITKSELAALKKKAVKKQYSVIVAGERRLRALELLWNEGCQDCQNRNQGKKVPHGKCLIKHLGSSTITVRVPQTQDPKQLLALQLSENIHERPNVHEEAEAIAKFAIFMKMENKSLSYSNMAKRMGKSPEMVSRALSFYDLPDSIRNFVREDVIKYGHALELARLKTKAKYSESDLIREVSIAVSHRQYAKVENFRKYVSGLILAYEQVKSCQSSELQMLFAVASPESRIRSALDPQTVIAARTSFAFLRKSVKLWEHPDSLPFVDGKKLSLGGLLEDYEKLVATLELVLPYVEKAVSVAEARKIREGVEKLSRTTKRKRVFHTA